MRRAYRIVALFLLAATAAVSRGSASPLPPEAGMPVLSYDAFGFGASWGGRVVAVARQGSRHQDDPTGRISLYTFRDGRAEWPPSTLIDTTLDDRNPAGGVTREGTLITFFARADGDRWVDLHAARTSRSGVTTTVRISTGDDAVFSPYGPLVVLPSGKLMQTVYGRRHVGGVSLYRVRALFSRDDGRTWGEERLVFETNLDQPSETAVALAGGASDDTATLIAVSRSARLEHGRWTSFLSQHRSDDGGQTWQAMGAAGGTSERGIVPWIANLGDGRLALVTADRVSMTIDVRIAPAAAVAADAQAWPAPRSIYRSRLADGPAEPVGPVRRSWSYGDFGYPSVVASIPDGAQPRVVFYDSHTGDSGFEPLGADTDLLSRPLF